MSAGREAWATRAVLEHRAALRFDSLAERVAALDPGSPVSELLARSACDERRHFERCLELVALAGGTPQPTADEVPPLAPRSLAPLDAVTFDITAACCVSETATVAMLTTLLQRMPPGRPKQVIQEVARDEVTHARVGWAHLERMRARGRTAFLSPWVPSMLEGTWGKPVDPPGVSAAELVRWGVLTVPARRQVFRAAVTDVIVPGLVAMGVDGGPALQWLARFEGAAAAEAAT